MGYKLLTTLIILLARLRKHWGYGKEWGLRKDRDELNLVPKLFVSRGNGLIIECCDCGLAHRFFEDEKGTHCWPERPKGYDYKWRFGG